MPQEIVFTDKPDIKFTDIPAAPTMDDRGWRVMEGKGMPPRPRVRSPEEKIIASSLTGGFSIPEPDPFYPVADYYDIGTDGAPYSALAKADLTMEEPEDYSRLLSEKSEFNPKGDHVPVYMHPELDSLVYKHPTTGREEIIVNPSSIFQGMAANPSASVGLITEIGAGIAASPGGPVAIAVSSAGAAFVNRIARLELGLATGINSYSQGKIVSAAMTDAGWVLAGAGLGELGGVLFRRLAGSSEVKRYIRSLSNNEFEMFVNTLEKFTDSAKKKYGVDINAGQVLQHARDSGADVPKYMIKDTKTLADKLAAESPELRKIKISQQKKVEELSGDIEKEALPNTPETALKGVDVSKDIKNVAAQKVKERISTINTASENMLVKYETEIVETLQVPELIGKGAYPGAYDNMIDSLKNARSKIFGKEGFFKKQYTEFWDRVGEPEVSLDEVGMVAKKHGANLENDLFPALAAEDADIVKNVLSSEDVVPMASVNRALSVIKAEIRSNPADKKAETGFLIEIKDALSDVRDKALKTVDDNAALELKALDTNYAKTSTAIDTSKINLILKTNKEGSFVTPVSTAIEAILGNKGMSAREFMKMAKDSTSPIFGSLGTVKTAIRSLYKNAIEGKEGAKRLSAHNAFINKNGEGLKIIMSKAEYKSFKEGVPTSLKAISLAERRAKNIETALMKTFKGRLSTKASMNDLSEMVSKSNTSIPDTRRIVSLLKSHPDTLDLYKGLRARRMLNKVQTADDLGEKVFDLTKLDDVLKSTEDVGELKVLFGSDFISGLRKIRDFGFLEKVPSYSELGSEFKRLLNEEGKASAALMAWRGFVARPLSRAGLLTTSFLKLTNEEAQESMGKLLADPKNLSSIMRLYRRNAPLEKWRTVLTNVGLANLLGDDE